MWGYQAIAAASNKIGIDGIGARSKVVCELIRQVYFWVMPAAWKHFSIALILCSST